MISVDVVSDIVCPWCFVGKKRLEQAVEMVDEIDVRVAWRPFQLDPTIPKGGHDRAAYMTAKFGSKEAVRASNERLTSIGREEGIAFDFDAIRISPNSLDAHRLVRWAAVAGGTIQSRLVDSLFSRYFERGENVGDHASLIEAARESGMDVALVETLLPTPADRAEVEGEIATASKMGITGVPCFLLEHRYAVIGAQEASVLADAIREVAAAKARGELDAPRS